MMISVISAERKREVHFAFITDITKVCRLLGDMIKLFLTTHPQTLLWLHFTVTAKTLHGFPQDERKKEIFVSP